MRAPSSRLLAYGLAGLVLLAGCATIMKGSKQKVTISSTPVSADVVVKSTSGLVFLESKTPTSVKLPKKNEYTVTVSLEGYQPETVNITKDGIAGWFWGNILCGGIIGIIVDVSTGAMNNLSTDDINVQLATAQLMNGKEMIYVVFSTLDSEGELRVLPVPLVKEMVEAAN